jgi:hypothetical protein
MGLSPLTNIADSQRWASRWFDDASAYNDRSTDCFDLEIYRDDFVEDAGLSDVNASSGSTRGHIRRAAGKKDAPPALKRYGRTQSPWLRGPSDKCSG